MRSGFVQYTVRLQSSPPAKIAKLRNTITCPAMSLQHPAKSRCIHAVRRHVPMGESITAAGAMNSHAHQGTEDEQDDGEERLIAGCLWFRMSCVRSPSSHRSASSRRRARLSASFPSRRRSESRQATRRTVACRCSTLGMCPPMAICDLLLASSMSAHIRRRSISTHAEQSAAEQPLVECL